MTTEKMTVHKALAELKTMDDRIRKAIRSATYVATNKHSNEKILGVTVSEYKDRMKSDYQKVEDLIKRRDALKRAVVLSNANTKVTISGKEYTVAEAIELKNNGVGYKRLELAEMTSQYNRAQSSLTQNSGEALEKRAESYVLSVIQAQPKDSKMSVDSDAMKSLRAGYIANNTYDLIDPNNILVKIEELDKDINEYEAEVDAALSVSNALTVIEFSY